VTLEKYDKPASSQQKSSTSSSNIGDQAPKLTNTTWRIGGREVRDVMEALVRKIWKDIEGVENLPARFPVLTYKEAMSRVSLSVL
jgi:aspartyl-tRNA synthetase